MEVLVSVVNEEQAIQAAHLGARWVDLKNPRLGPLGRASTAEQRALCQSLAPWPRIRRSVALGEFMDYCDSSLPQPLPQPLPGFQFAKLGTAKVKTWRQTSAVPISAGSGRTSTQGNTCQDQTAWFGRWCDWYQSLPTGTVGVLVLYADATDCEGITIEAGLELARCQHLPYVLIDTYDKTAGGLFAILRRKKKWERIPDWIQYAKDQGIRLAWAGQLTVPDLEQMRDWQADIVGVRSAICLPCLDGQIDRNGEICPAKMKQVLELESVHVA